MWQAQNQSENKNDKNRVNTSQRNVADRQARGKPEKGISNTESQRQTQRQENNTNLQTNENKKLNGSEGPDFMQYVTPLLDNFNKWVMSDTKRLFEITSKFRINDSSKLISESLNKNIDYLVSLQSTNIDSANNNFIKGRTSLKLYSHEELTFNDDYLSNTLERNFGSRSVAPKGIYTSLGYTHYFGNQLQTGFNLTCPLSQGQSKLDPEGNSSVNSLEGTDSVASSIRDFAMNSVNYGTEFEMFFRFSTPKIDLEGKVNLNQIWSQSILYKYGELFKLRFSLITNTKKEEVSKNRSKIGLGFEIGN